MHFYEFVTNFLLTAKLHFPEHKIWSNMSTFELLQGPPIGQIHSYFAIESYAKNIDIFCQKKFPETQFSILFYFFPSNFILLCSLYGSTAFEIWLKLHII